MYFPDQDHKLCYHTTDSVPASVYETFVADMHVSEQDIQYIESHTVGQSKNSYWHTVRKGMITASNFKKVCECVSHNRNLTFLVKTLLGEYGDVKYAPLTWGTKKEKFARDLYQRAARKKHIGSYIDSRELRTFQEKPYIGCSVDGLLQCKCKNHDGSKVVEIKCPYSDRKNIRKKLHCLKCLFKRQTDIFGWQKIMTITIKSKVKLVFMVIALQTWLYIQNREFML